MNHFTRCLVVKFIICNEVIIDLVCKTCMKSSSHCQMNQVEYHFPLKCSEV